ncbi:MAG: cytochrome c biogenesis protein CcsA [Candidatus Omnitrophica bacterium]|nr:cytochrome c biogenesis protein CcsA [Candidatus Omnitrophota bacterium]
MFLVKFFGSLRFALFLIGSLALILTVSTWLESAYGTPFAQRHFYQSIWFDVFLGFFALNIFCAAVSRYPYKKHHTGFVVTHIGILILLFGAFLARATGVEGQMTLFENKEKNRILLQRFETKTLTEGAENGPFNPAIEATLSSEMAGMDQPFMLIANDPDNPHSATKQIGPARFELKTVPAVPLLKIGYAGKIYPIPLKESTDVPLENTGLKIRNIRYYPSAKIENKTLINAADTVRFNPAAEFEVVDDRGRVERHTKFFLFPHFPSLRGGPSNNIFDLGVFLEVPAPDDLAEPEAPGFTFLFKEGRWSYVSRSSRGTATGDLTAGQKIQTGWMDMTLDVKKTFARARITKTIGKIETEGSRPVSQTLPFSLTLKDFRKVDYPGTTNPASFESDVVLRDGQAGVTLDRTIKMNEPLDYKGWRVFQASYILSPELGEASVFSVAKNPGIVFIYSGALVILIGVILLFYLHPFFKNGSTAAIVLACLLLAGCSSQDPVRHNGRVKPFDSFARQTLRLVAGSENWRGQSAGSLVKDLSQNPSKTENLEWIRLDFEELKSHLGMPVEKRYFSSQDIRPRLGKIGVLVQSAKKKRDKDERPSKLEQKAELLYTQYVTVEKLIQGTSPQPVPSAETIRPSALTVEVLVNRFKPFELAAVFYFLVFLLGFFKRKKVLLLFLGLALIAHTAGIVARVFILQRPPVSNMYESMIFMNWALVAFALGFAWLRKNTLPLVAGSAASGLVMLYANLLPLDPSLDVLVPVLRSNYWLSVHVMTVVSSYGAFGLAMALGHRHLFLNAFGKLTPRTEEESADLIYRIIQLGTILIGTGTVLGGVWANESWGRFWGWDPKETWALITTLAYLIVIHLKFAKKISHFYLAIASVLGFLVVLMTWYGVNFVLGRGLHSYGAGSGGMNWVIYYLIGETIFLGYIFFRKFRMSS